jgi:hypothetical protein
MVQHIVRHFTPLILRRNIRTTTAIKSSDYPTKLPYDFPDNKTLETIDNIVKETSNNANVEELRQHHFNTFQIVQDLKNQGFTQEQAVVIMKGMKFKLRERYDISTRQQRERERRLINYV